MKHTEETKQKLSIMRRGKKNPFYGHKHTPETKARLAAITRQMNAKRQYVPRPRTITLPTDPASMGYLAGIIDGEGSVRFTKGRPFVAVYNTSTILMRWLISTVGGSIPRPDNRGREPNYQWRISAARDVYHLCFNLQALLKIKADDAGKVIAFLDTKYGKEVLLG